MAGHGGEYRLHVVRENTGMVLNECMRTGCGDQRKRTGRRQSGFDVRRFACKLDQRLYIIDEWFGHMHFSRSFLQLDQHLCIQGQFDLAQKFAPVNAGNQFPFALLVGVPSSCRIRKRSSCDSGNGNVPI